MAKRTKSGGYDKSVSEMEGLVPATIHRIIYRWCDWNAKQQNDDLYRNGRYWCHLTAEQICNEVGAKDVSVKTVRRALKKLFNAGLIKCEKRGRMAGNTVRHKKVYYAEEFCAKSEMYKWYFQDKVSGQNGQTVVDKMARQNIVIEQKYEKPGSPEPSEKQQTTTKATSTSVQSRADYEPLGEGVPFAEGAKRVLNANWRKQPPQPPDDKPKSFEGELELVDDGGGVAAG